MGGKVIDKDWRNGTSAMEMLVDAVRRCGGDQCYWMCREVVRVCCPRAIAATTNRKTLWGFIDGVQYGPSLTGTDYNYMPAYRPMPVDWNRSQVVHQLHIAVENYIRQTGAAKTAKNRLNRTNALICDIIRDIFPENPALLLREETRNHAEFLVTFTSFLLEQMPGPIFADWLQDQGEDDAANHLRGNKTGATPYWLSGMALWWEDQPAVTLEPIAERLRERAEKRKNAYLKVVR
jgi:hypothetical protein